MQDPMVSIIVPVYNVEDYLPECIDSIINQTYKNIEIILIDDGSTDGSGHICDNYAKKDNRVKVIHKKNSGVHTARNLGMEISSGDYIQFVDGDDWISKEMVYSMVQAINKYNVDVVHCNYVREFANMSAVKEAPFFEEKVYIGEECRVLCRRTVGLIKDELRFPECQDTMAPLWLNLYRRDVLIDHNIRCESTKKYGTSEDCYFNIQVTQNIKSFTYIDKAFYHYRKNNVASYTTVYRDKLCEKEIVLFQDIKTQLHDIMDADFEEAFRSRILLSCLGLCMNEMKKSKKITIRMNGIKEIICKEPFHSAAMKLDISYMPIKWKLYYYFIRIKLFPMVYFMTYAIQTILKRRK